MSSDLMDAAQRLTEVLTQENAALKRLDFPAAVALVAAKEAALADLTKQQKAPALPPAMMTVGQRLGELAAENQTLLERAIAVQTRIVRIIARAGVPPPAVSRYGNHPGRTLSTRAGAMALSTRV